MKFAQFQLKARANRGPVSLERQGGRTSPDSSPASSAPKARASARERCQRPRIPRRRVISSLLAIQRSSVRVGSERAVASSLGRCLLQRVQPAPRAFGSDFRSVSNVVTRAARPKRPFSLLVWSSVVAPVPLLGLSLIFEGTARWQSEATSINAMYGRQPLRVYECDEAGLNFVCQRAAAPFAPAAWST